MSKNRLLIIGVAVLVALGIGATIYFTSGEDDPVLEVTAGDVTAVPLSDNKCTAPTLFGAVSPDQTNINFQNVLNTENLKKYAFNGAGVAVADYDQDGFTDIFLVSEETANKLYRNNGDLTFTDVTSEAGFTDAPPEAGHFQIGAHFADFNSDGYPDLFLTNWRTSNQLYMNNGDGSFSETTEAAGVVYAGGSTTATTADYDRDGDLDLFVATYRPFDFAVEYGTPELELVDNEVRIPEQYQDWLEIVPTNSGATIRQLGETDLLYRNNGDGTFEEVSQQAGIDVPYWGLSATFTDIDNDGWPDLYVTNDFWSPDQFYRNNGDGTFSDVAIDQLQHTPMYAMGIDFADINNDGLTDYFIGDMMSRDHTKRMTQHAMINTGPLPEDAAPQLMRNSLYINNGDGSFSDIAWLADVASTEWTWTTKFADIDLDGFVDLLITNGMVVDIMNSDEAAKINADFNYVPQYPLLDDKNLVFRNNGDLTFTDVSVEWGFNTQAIGHGGSVADFDNDGDFEMVVNYLNETAGFYCNTSENDRMRVRLQGTLSNRDGIGARITLETDQGTQTRLINSSGGYLSSHEPVAVFGLGNSSELIGLTIEWPSGQVQTVTDLEANMAYTISEPVGDVQLPPAEQLAPEEPQFEEVAQEAGIIFTHVESDFNDFSLQMLLPRKLSVFGPGVAWGDPDFDGDDDLYVTGASGQAGGLFLNNGDGTFEGVTLPTNNINSEENGALWASFTTPWPDLFISYGQVETQDPTVGVHWQQLEAQSFNGDNWFEQSPASSGALAAADYDGDGDLDLFVGGRVERERWPLPTQSQLYRNDNGNLTPTNLLPPTLGMVTGAVWSDIDDDADPDLLLSTEFGSLQLWRNEGGTFSNATAEVGLDQWTGLWTGIVTGDFNEDGRFDIAVANLGLNTKYTASPEQPMVVFAGNVNGLEDMPDTETEGDIEIIEAYYQGDTLYPIKEWGMARADMPFLEDQFETFQQFGEATLEEIYGDRLDLTQRFEANTLAHMVFLQGADGRFTAQPLPTLAQATAGYGLTVADFDNDGHEDLYLTGNFSYADHETHSYTGGVSYWLRGDGSGQFTVIPSKDSGLFVPYDGRGTAVADYNGDGWVDIVVGVNDQPVQLYRNTGGEGMCGLRVSLQNNELNPPAIGAKIIVERSTGGRTVREVQAGSGFLSQSSSTLIFGLRDTETASVTVRWPDGQTTRRQNAGCENLILNR